MPVKKEPDGGRSVEAEVIVPGSPDEVWKAIATGPGVSAWFVPCKVEEGEGGSVTCNFGPGMDSVATIKTWNPPHSFSAEGEDGPGKVATEWTVEAKDGGSCVVRVVHRWFASTDDWDAQFEGHTHGWNAFFRILRLYLAHFSGERSALIQLTGFAPEPKEAAWKSLMDKLGFHGAVVGGRVATGGSAPSLGGVVERVGEEAFPEELLLRLEQPTPGVAHLFAMAMGGQILLSLRYFLYGPAAADVAADVEPRWQAWIAENFPAAGGPAPCR